MRIASTGSLKTILLGLALCAAPLACKPATSPNATSPADATPTAATDAGLPTVAYTLPRDSKISIAIYDDAGHIVRQLLMGADRKAGPHAEAWNGVTDAGTPAPAGHYAWKMLTSQGLTAHWITSLGSGLHPGWQIMPGNHIGAVNVTFAGDDLLVMGGCSEVVPGMARITRAGKVLWESGDMLEGNNDCGAGLADGKLFSLLSNAKVIAVDPATGHGVWKIDTPWNDPKQVWKPGREVIGLAEASIPHPGTMAVDGHDAVLVVSGHNVLRLSQSDTTPRVILADLPAPEHIAADPSSGQVLVAEGGDLQQIQRFGPDGKLLATYGRKGGREFGPYHPEDFLGMTGLCADRDGGFIVTEGNAAPRRVARFDAQGKLVDEWYGGLHYANFGVGDPADASIAWFDSGSGQIVKAKIDFLHHSYRVLETYQWAGIGDGIITSGGNVFAYVRHVHGQTYLVNNLIEPGMVRVDADNHRLVPVVAGKYFLRHDLNNPSYTAPPLATAYLGHPAPAVLTPTDLPKKGDRDAVLWSDLNGDGLAEPDEMRFSPRTLLTWSDARVWADDDLNLYEMNDRPMRWTVQRWTAAGTPVYGSWEDWKPIGDKPTDFDPVQVAWPAGSGIAPLSDGSIMGFFNSTVNPFGKGIGSDGLGGNFIVKWDRAGHEVWRTGFHSADFGAAPGEARFFWNIAGVAHDCLVVTDMQCYYTIKNLVHVWDSDGLWVGRLLENPDLTVAPASAYNLCTENFGGTLIQITDKNKAPGLEVGDVLFYGCGQNVTSVYRITGWDTFHRQAGSIDLRPDQMNLVKAAAEQTLARRTSSGKDTKIKKAAVATLPRLASPPVLDGKLDDAAWKNAGVIDDFRLTPADEDAEPDPTRILAGYDDQNLYLAVRCAEPAMDKLRAVGSPVYLDDSVELFVDRGCDRQHYFQIIVNSKGDYYVGQGWNIRPEVHIQTHAGREAGAWVVEMAIGWKSIDATAPAPGERLGFEAVRNHYAGEEYHAAWSPLYGNSNHSPTHFGTLYAGAALPPSAIAARDGLAFFHRLPDGPMPLDGKLDKWKGVEPLKILNGAKTVGDLYLGYKSDGLYAAFDITTDRPWKNAADSEMAFNGGAACDLQIGPLGDHGKTIVPGDERFLVAPVHGQATVVDFLPKLTADLSAADRALRTYHTEAQGDDPFDRVAALGAGDAIAVAKPNGTGYIVEMRIPLRAPMKLVSGQRFRFDASIILANPDGTQAELRLPWFSTDAADMFVASDVVLETKLHPWNWGVGELE